MAFEVKVGGYRVPVDARLEKANTFVNKAVEDQNYTEAATLRMVGSITTVPRA